MKRYKLFHIAVISAGFPLRGTVDALRKYVLGKNETLLSLDLIEKIVSAYKASESVDKYTYLATHEELAENVFNLNIRRYVDTFEEEEEIDLMAVRADRLTLKSELAELELKMEENLKELEYFE